MSHPHGPVGGTTTRSTALLVASVAALLVLVLVVSTSIGEGVADDGRSPSSMTAGAVGGFGCSPSPTPTPDPTPKPTPEPSAGASPVGVVTVGLAAVVGSDVGGDGPSAIGDAVADRPRGIDISKWDGAVDMGLVEAAGVRFVITKATQGTAIVDPWYSEHIAAARAQGIAVGSYHFFDYRRDGVTQANLFVDTMEANGAILDTLPPVVDVECSLSMGQSDRVKARVRLRKLVDRVYQRTGRIVMIYTSAHMWGHVTGNDLTFGAHPLWVAYWNKKAESPILPKGWTDWLFWQRGPLEIPGIARRFDGNVAAGTESAVQRLRSRRMVVAGGADITRERSVSLRLRGLDGTQIRTALDDGDWSGWVDRSAAGEVTIHGRDGLRRVRVQARDTRGTLGPVASDDITLDATAPVAAAPALRLRSDTLASGSKPIPIRVTWSISDPGTGVVAARVRAECDGVSLIHLDPAPARTEPQSVIDGADDHQVASRARCTSSAVVTDGAGNTTSTDKRTLTVRAISESPSKIVTYSKGWKRLAQSSAFGGTLRSSSTPDRWVRLRFTGTEVALVAVRGPDRGRIRVSIDGRGATTVDLRSSTTDNRRIVFRKRLSPGSHTIEVRVIGTAKHPRKGARVDIDGFLVIGP